MILFKTGVMKYLQDKKLLIFDCDGVLFDSEEANRNYFYDSMAIAGYTELPEHIEQYVGYMSMSQLINQFIEDSDEQKRVFDICMQNPYDSYITLLKPLADFNVLFNNLRSNYLLSMATNRGKSLHKLFTYFNLHEFFQFKISALDARPKPAPDMLFKTIEFFNITKDAVLFIGDSISDYQAAENAGIEFLWVGNKEKNNNISSISELAVK